MAANPGTIFTFSSSTPQNPEQRLLQLESFCRQAQATIEQLQKENLYLKQVLVRDEKAKLKAPAKCGGDRDKLSGFFCNCVPISPTTPNVSQLREIRCDTRPLASKAKFFSGSRRPERTTWITLSRAVATSPVRSATAFGFLPTNSARSLAILTLSSMLKTV